MSEKMSNAPVYYALAQVQFNPVAAMAKYVDEVQDILRREGYTLYEPQEIRQLQFIAAAGEAPAEPKLTQINTWLITKADRSSGFILGPSSLTYHTTHYETSEEFLPELLHGLKAVHKVVGLDHLSRLGVRYLDAVIPTEGETVELYLASGLRGVEFGATQRYGLSESVFETESGPLLSNGTLVARVHRATSQLGYPPDLIPNGLVPMTRFESKSVVSHAIIDTDHFVEGRMPLDFEQIHAQFVSLHKIIKLAFEATTTDHARKVVWA
ncbi:TIGR04255 family protein [Methylomonas methanica]|nr:TIGR04255 family protein [Methylomonas methanica]